MVRPARGLAIRMRMLLGFLVTLTIVASSSADESTAELLTRLKNVEAKAASLEVEVARLKIERANDELLRQLRGQWTEVSRLELGQAQREADEVEWRLESEVDSDRMVLAVEVSQEIWGRMKVDASQSPAWIDFEYVWNGKTNVLRGLVKYEYKRATIALPVRTYDGSGFDSPKRPTSFESTPDNKVTVYSLIRPDYKQYGR